jgi:hypothetical protein
MLYPSVTWACAVCGSAEEKASGAYLAMTVFLSLLPLSLIGGVGFYLWKRSQQIARENAELVQPEQSSPAWAKLITDLPTEPNTR